MTNKCPPKYISETNKFVVILQLTDANINNSNNNICDKNAVNVNSNYVCDVILV